MMTPETEIQLVLADLYEVVEYSVLTQSQLPMTIISAIFKFEKTLFRMEETNKNLQEEIA